MLSNTLKKVHSETLLTLCNISKHYISDNTEGFRILNFIRKKDIGINNFNIEVKKGQVLGIVGDTQSGKTTILKVLSGIIKPTSGAVYLHGEKACTKTLIENVSYIAKDKTCPIQYNCTLIENIIQYIIRDGTVRSVAFDLAESLIDEFKMNEYKFKEVIRLPNNIRKRMFFTKGLLSHKDIICFDEPFLYIEDEYRQKFEQEIIKLCKEKGKAIVITDKQKSDIINICDDIIVL